MNKLVSFLFLLSVIAGCGLQFLDHTGVPVPMGGGNSGGNLADNEFEPTPSPSPSPSGDSGPVVDPNLVVYEIQPGTASQAWGTASNPITAKVGQTLRVVNKDSVVHRIHTGGKPFNHTNNIAAGASADFKLVQAITTKAVGPETYEHNYGTNSPIFFNITP